MAPGDVAYEVTGQTVVGNAFVRPPGDRDSYFTINMTGGTLVFPVDTTEDNWVAGEVTLVIRRADGNIANIENAANPFDQTKKYTVKITEA